MKRGAIFPPMKGTRYASRGWPAPGRLRHAAFLARPAEVTLTPDPRSRRAQAAFLALRVVDLLASPGHETPQAFEYQRSATARYVADVGEEPHHETALLGTILARSAPENPRPPLLASLRDYAEYLDAIGNAAESVDVLETLLRLALGSEPPAEWIEPLRQAVRILTRLDRIDDAAALHRQARRTLVREPDLGVRLRARLAGVDLMAATGDAVAAERAARRCWTDVQRSDDQTLRWAVAVGIAGVLLRSPSPVAAEMILATISGPGRPAPSPAAGLDLAGVLLEAGQYAAAADRVREAREHDTTEAVRFRAIRLNVEVSARRGDQMGLVRGIRECGELFAPDDVARLRRILNEAQERSKP